MTPPFLSGKFRFQQDSSDIHIRGRLTQGDSPAEIAAELIVAGWAPCAARRQVRILAHEWQQFVEARAGSAVPLPPLAA